jgi:hypothetical protein
MANKLKSKGTSLLQSISSVYTAIPELISVSLSGEKGETFDGTTLDGSVHKTKPATGYVEPLTISAEVFWDPDDTTHQAFTTVMRACTPTNFKITYTDNTPTSEVYAGTAFGRDVSAAAADGLKATLTIETSGTPS